jgi:hypothetical protein
MHVVESGSYDTALLLLRVGCPWNLLDRDHYCAGEYAGGHPSIMQLIMEWGVKAEIVLGNAQRQQQSAEASTRPASNSSYLQQKLQFSEDGKRLLDAEGEAVMMVS